MTEQEKSAAQIRREKAKAKALAAKRATKKQLKRSRVAKQTAGFVEFIRQQGIVGLAIGLAIGTQATILIRAIVDSLVTPFVDLLVGPGGLSGLTLTVNIGARSAVFDFGLLINAIINFLAVAIVIYFVIMGLRLDKLDKKKES